MDKSGQTISLTISRFLNLLSPYYSKNFTNTAFTDLILKKYMASDKEIELFSDKSESLLSGIFSGNKELSKQKASTILSNIDKQNFIAFLNEAGDDVPPSLVKAFSPYIPTTNNDSIYADIADLFEIVLSNIASKTTKPKTKINESGILSTEKQLENIITFLSKIKSSEFQELNLNPVVIRNKVSDNNTLATKIFGNVAFYYSYLQSFLKEQEMENQIDSNKIEILIKGTYKKIASTTNSQEEVFNKLATWLSSITFTRISSCEIVISYFVQNCEVFDAPTK